MRNKERNEGKKQLMRTVGLLFMRLLVAERRDAEPAAEGWQIPALYIFTGARSVPRSINRQPTIEQPTIDDRPTDDRRLSISNCDIDQRRFGLMICLFLSQYRVDSDELGYKYTYTLERSLESGSDGSKSKPDRFQKSSLFYKIAWNLPFKLFDRNVNTAPRTRSNPC